MLSVTQMILQYICYLSTKNVSNMVTKLEMIEEQLEKDFVSKGSDTIS